MEIEITSYNFCSRKLIIFGMISSPSCSNVSSSFIASKYVASSMLDFLECNNFKLKSLLNSGWAWRAKTLSPIEKDDILQNELPTIN